MHDKYAHRKASAKIAFTRSDGSPLARREVAVDLVRHEFLFGSGAFQAVDYAGGRKDGGALSAERRAYLGEALDKITALFNFATLPFYWGRYEEREGCPDEERTQKAARYLQDKGVRRKGHPLCWHTVCAPWLMAKSNDDIMKTQVARVKREVSAFAGRIDMWDVVNEAVIMPVFDKYDNAMTRLCKETGRVKLIKTLFDAAHETNPAACLLLNDFDLSRDYENLIEECLAAGAPISAIGLQTHQHQGYRGRDYFEDVIARFSRFGLPLHFTENTLISGRLMPTEIVDLNDYQVDDWSSTPEGEDRQAREITELYETLFASPKVSAITNWDSIDGAWLGAPSGLLRKDLSCKPAYEALFHKIKTEWHTRAVLVTDERGEAELRGFCGAYSAKAADGDGAYTFTLCDAEPRVKAALE